VHTHNNGARGMHNIGYILSCDNLVKGARRLLV
jgi:hypothetical protein